MNPRKVRHPGVGDVWMKRRWARTPSRRRATFRQTLLALDGVERAAERFLRLVPEDCEDHPLEVARLV